MQKTPMILMIDNNNFAHVYSIAIMGDPHKLTQKMKYINYDFEFT